MYSTPIGARLPNPATINVNNDDDAQYEAVEACQKYSKDKDIPKDSAGSTVAVWKKDEEVWMLIVIEEPNSSNHRVQSYIIWITKTGSHITHNMIHIQNTPITME